MKLGPISGFRTGDRVRVVKEVRNIETPDPLPVGTVGVLGNLYRVQEGFEIWAFWADKRIAFKRLFGLSHKDVEREDV